MATQNNATASATSGGVGLFGLTFIVLLVLKLTGLVHISWWWVFSPLLIGAGLVVTILLLVFAAVLLVAFFGDN